MAWQWESNWYLETTFNRHKLENDGWTYAVDFPAEYHSKKSFVSCVRRRKWIRYRRYIANNTWSVVSPIHKDPSEEQLLEVTLLTMNAVKRFGIKPIISMLSYSNFGSSKDKETVKINRVIKKLQNDYPSLLVDGEMQANFALNKNKRMGLFPT